MDTNKPTLPGFTAEAGLYMTRNHYRLAAPGRRIQTAASGTIVRALYPLRAALRP